MFYKFIKYIHFYMKLNDLEHVTKPFLWILNNIKVKILSNIKL